MNLNYIENPCKPDCPERTEGCHPKCKKYKRYTFLCNVDKQRYQEEKKIDDAVREITYDGYVARQTNKSEALKHGRKT